MNFQLPVQAPTARRKTADIITVVYEISFALVQDEMVKSMRSSFREHMFAVQGNTHCRIGRVVDTTAIIQSLLSSPGS